MTTPDEIQFFRRGSAATFESDSTIIGSTTEMVPKGDQKVSSSSSLSLSGSGLADSEATAEGGGGGGEIVDLRAERPDGTQTYKACATLVCCVAGVGTLGMPYAAGHKAGIILGSVIVIMTLIFSIFTGRILIECLYLKTDRRRESYHEIALAAGGLPGYYFAYGVVVINLFGCAVLYLILSGSLIENVFDYCFKRSVLPSFFYVAISAGTMWAILVCTKSMKESAWISIIGSLTTILVVMITVAVSSDMMIHKAVEVTVATHQLANWSQAANALATISFAYGGNVVYPHVEASMKHPRSWNRALTIALCICFVLYITIATVAYAAFGNGTLSPILRNLPQGPISIVANLLIVLHVLLAGPILLTSLSMTVESSIAAKYPAFEQGSSKIQYLKRCVPRSIIVFLAGLVAAVVPFFGDVMDLLGSLTMCLLVFVMPVLFYFRLKGFRKMRLGTIIMGVVVLLIGVAALVVGTIDAIEHLTGDIKRQHAR